ncbi:MAG: mechanosensitive ion channel family protein [Kofleriaceae bacterium]|nr:mechanosensitive ion channel family protein [Myxococcales bacterium]MCB9565442.1 mechanosensitive ion channel family protein [Kofleriaceae bacterium]
MNADEILPYVAGGSVMIAGLVVGLIARSLVTRKLAGWASKSESRVDDAIVASLRRPMPWWGLLIGIHIGVGLMPLEPRYVEISGQVVESILILSCTLWAADLLVRLLELATQARAGHDIPLTGLARNITRGLIFGIGGMILLGSFGISITPLLTTLGIGGLAVALGLQDTLANLFAGVHIMLAGNFRKGDFVKLETGQEGHVEDIGWRSTRIKLLANNLVILPNSRLAQSLVINYDLPSQDQGMIIQCGVHYASDLELVERVTIEVGREVLGSVTGGVADFTPLVRFHTFNSSSIDFSVILRVKTYVDNYLLKHEFIKRLQKRYAAENISIPFPITAVNLDQEGADKILRRSA